jgi:predicted LPLAT superfamily acyltransferase
MITAILAQVGEDGLNLPDDTGSTIVFVAFLAIIVGLWFMIRRSRRRAEDEFWERKRAEREGRPPQPPESP